MGKILDNAAAGAAIGGTIGAVASMSIVPKDVDISGSTLEKACAAAVVLPTTAAGAAIGAIAGAMKGVVDSIADDQQ